MRFFLLLILLPLLAASSHAQSTRTRGGRILNLPVVSSTKTVGRAHRLTVTGTTAYVSNWKSGLEIYDVADASAPVRLGGIKTSGVAGAVCVAHDIAYVAARGGSLQVIDVSNPKKPSLIKSVAFSNEVFAATVVGAKLYVACGRVHRRTEDTGMVVAMDISDPRNPIATGSVDTPDLALEIAVAGTLAYVSCRYAGLVTIDLSDAAKPKLIGSVDTPGEALEAVVSGSTVFLADGKSGMQVIDATDPKRLKIIATARTGRHAWGITRAGTSLMVADALGLRVLDASNPNKPVAKGLARLAGSPFGVAVAGKLAFIGANDSARGGLQIVNLAGCVADSVVGSWMSERGQITLLADGKGTDAFEHRTLVGELSSDGKTWTGRWHRGKPDLKSGDAKFELTSRGQLRCRYWEGAASPRAKASEWNATRLKSKVSERPPVALTRGQLSDRTALLGSYRREPIENGWHEGFISRHGDGLRWLNKAGKSWKLSFDAKNDRLLTGPNNPYIKEGRTAFEVLRDKNGIRGFRFGNETYLRNGGLPRRGPPNRPRAPRAVVTVRILDTHGKPLGNKILVQGYSVPNYPGLPVVTVKTNSEGRAVFRHNDPGNAPQRGGAASTAKHGKSAFYLILRAQDAWQRNSSGVGSRRSLPKPSNAATMYGGAYRWHEFKPPTKVGDILTYDLGDVQLVEEPVLVAGTVVDTDGKPIEGALVGCDQNFYSASVIADSRQALTHRAITDANGRFVMRELSRDPGSLTLWAKKTGYALPISGTKITGRSEAARIVMQPGCEAAGSFAAWPAGVAQWPGRVYFWPAGEEFNPLLARTAELSGNGFRCRDLAAGNYDVGVALSAPNTKLVWRTASVRLTQDGIDGDKIRGIDWNEFCIFHRFKVIDSEGQPINDVRTTARSTSSRRGHPLQQDSQGRFFGFLQPDTTSITLLHAHHEALTIEAPFTEELVRLVSKPRIAVRITNLPPLSGRKLMMSIVPATRQRGRRPPHLLLKQQGVDVAKDGSANPVCVGSGQQQIVLGILHQRGQFPRLIASIPITIDEAGHADVLQIELTAEQLAMLKR